MKASCNWLRELVPQARNTSSEEIARMLTGAGLEVEATIPYGAGTEGCLVAAVISTRPHPTKSGLRLVTVDLGDRHQEVICGAPNVPESGGLVVLAPLGAHLPAKNMTIGRRDIGGVTSEGMLCSESELGLSEEGGGILVLPQGSGKPGKRLLEAFPFMRDTILEIGLTPNRPDGLGHIGLARELAALHDLAVFGSGAPSSRSPASSGPSSSGPSNLSGTLTMAPLSLCPRWAPRPVPPFGSDEVPFSVELVIEDRERCPHYGAAIAEAVAVGPSPLSWRCRLTSLGVRPISNLVDVTNLVMLEYGQPMHAFDLARVRGQKIVVRRARLGESLSTLDGVTRALHEDDLVICDGEGPVALAGVMGGQGSEISGETRRVLFECAHFEPRGIRRAGRRHGLHTESSHRFERGTDPGAVPQALARAVALTREVLPELRVSRPRHAAGGSVLEAPPALERARATMRASFMSRILGVEVPLDEAIHVLERLGCELESREADRVSVSIPTHRPDLSREIDLIEEVIRVQGIDTIPSILPAIRGSREQGSREAYERRVRAEAVSLGLSEAITFRFTSRESLDAVFAPEPAVILANPINEHQTVMRTSLLPGLFEAVASARRHGERSARLFALGPRFLPGPAPGGLPEERASFAAVLAGDRPSWLSRPAPVDAWDAKGLAVSLVARLTGREPGVMAYASSERPRHLHPRAAGRLVLGEPLEVEIGSFGLPHPEVTDAFDLGADVVLVELDLERLARVPRTVSFAPIARFPASSRDVALVVPDEVPAGAVLEAVRSSAGPLARAVHLFDRFVGGAIPEGHTSLGVRVVYRADERTLTDAEVDACHVKVVAYVGALFGATLRT